ncbi:ABC transporter substrate-binding protein [Opacimonas viscosa]|uniref:ABC transporter substrate-binding protein n=1 Tax=Opacimonas viscosa TaxID=2961944 RepID=A0AA42BLE0_9ALTE|nr:ABC transporter substrate-binding protein [Opacimonas viscosa]MCP3427492.1 ABC transporter substrate-binding protein [Opacimonas viscosa]
MVPIVKKVLSCTLLTLGIFSACSSSALTEYKTSTTALANATKALPVINVGVLKFGTINWEMDVIKHHGLDIQNGYTLNIIPFASKNAASAALQSHSVDIIMTDVFWVAKQQSMRKPYLLYPTTKLTGGIYSRQNHPTFAQWLSQNPRIGIAGGKYDKNWLVTQAYIKHQDLEKTKLQLTFAAPPLLNRMVQKENNTAVINFWHYTARLKTLDFVPIITTSEMLQALNINTDVPMLGWAFHTTFASDNETLLTQFLHSSHQAKQLLLGSKREWERIRHLIKAENEDIFIQLYQDYPKTLLNNFTAAETISFADAYSIFAETLDLSLDSPTNVFWPKAQSVWLEATTQTVE